MIVRALDSNGDWTFGKGKNNYLSDTKAIVQNISTRLNSYLGDCFFALDEGVDWFNLLGAKDQIALGLSVNKVIMATDGVLRLIDSSLDLDHDSRRITMRYTVSTVYSVANQVPPVANITSYLLTQDGLVLTTEDGDPLVAG